MNPASEGSASELLANLSVGTVVLIALALTVLRFALLLPGMARQRGRAPEGSSWARGIAEVMESLIIAGVLVFLIIRPFFVQAFFIPSESMEDTLLGHDAGINGHADTVHDHIFVSKLAYRLGVPERGDIAVFKAPKEADVEGRERGAPKENTLIKRIIALGGDTIEVKEGAVFVNGKKLNEPYIKRKDGEPPMADPQPPNAEFGVDAPLTLGKDEIFVMGDNRNNSNDSRFWGTLTRDRLIGKAVVIFWPLSRIRMLQ